MHPCTYKTSLTRLSAAMQGLYRCKRITRRDENGKRVVTKLSRVPVPCRTEADVFAALGLPYKYVTQVPYEKYQSYALNCVSCAIGNPASETVSRCLLPLPLPLSRSRGASSRTGRGRRRGKARRRQQKIRNIRI